jgi:hypothetical protein
MCNVCDVDIVRASAQNLRKNKDFPDGHFVAASIDLGDVNVKTVSYI